MTLTHINPNTITITVTLELSKALVRDHTDSLLSENGVGMYSYDLEELTAAWQRAVEAKLERLAVDADVFLHQFALEETFFSKLGI